MIRLVTLLSVLLMLSPAHIIHAQNTVEQSGRVFLTDWPHQFIGTDLLPLHEADSLFQSELVPYIDSLIVNYQYRIEDDRPHFNVSIAWVPGEMGVLDGEWKAFSDFPGEVRLMSVELLADVHVDDLPAAQLVIGADSMVLSPVDQAYEFTGYGLAFDNVFVNVPAQDARRIFASGFSLENLRIVSISFEMFETEEVEVQQRRRRVIEIHRRHPPRRMILIPRVHVNIGWHIGPRWYVPPRPRSARPDDAPRGDSVTRGEQRSDDAFTGRTRTRTGTGTSTGTDSGRGTSVGTGGRTTGTSTDARGRGSGTSAESPGQRTGSSTEARGRGSESETRGRGTSTRGSTQSDDGKSSTTRTRTRSKDDDDDSWIDSGALAAVAAVGAFAVLGGSVGYYGHMSQTPFGLSAGYISPQGGLLLQTGVNDAMIGGTGDDPRRAMLKATGFFNILDAPIMPAIGVGVIGTEQGSDVLLDPVFSLGAAVNINEFLLYGGYDLANQSIELGFSVNIRQIILNNRRRAGG